MQNKEAEKERKKIIPNARGVVLEIGFGSGLNLPLYTTAVTHLYALEPSRKLWELAHDRVQNVSFHITHLQTSAEQIPLDDGSIDTVVSTWSLCSIPDPLQALREVRRVLKPSGIFILIEHGQSKDPAIATWQRRLTPVWKKMTGGCHLNRPVISLLREAGFDTSQVEQGYIEGQTRKLKILRYGYRGIATLPVYES